MDKGIVDRLHGEFRDLVALLDQAAEPSLRNTAEENFRKALLLAAASYFETRVMDVVLDFVRNVSNGEPLMCEFVKRKALERQFHTLFDWEAQNANRFFRFFGNAFSEFMTRKVRQDTELAEAIRAFMEIGLDRNRLVHQDFGSFALEKTVEEIYSLYTKANKFVSSLGACLANGASAARGEADAT
jgi:hypothetical protein